MTRAATNLADIAAGLRRARDQVLPCEQVASDLPDPALASAYDVQDINVSHWSADAPRVGHKVGFASRLSQRLAGLSGPLYGALLSDMAYCDGEEVDSRRFCHPKVEVELAIVLAEDVTSERPGYGDVARAVGFVLPAVEIVDPRYRDWVMTPVDAVADDTGAAGFVLGGSPRQLNQVSFDDLAASLSINGERVSSSGDPLFASYPLSTVLWVARHLAGRGQRLSAGDVVMAGALAPPAMVRPGSAVSATVSGVGTCRFEFGPVA